MYGCAAAGKAGIINDIMQWNFKFPRVGTFFESSKNTWKTFSAFIKCNTHDQHI